MDVGKSTIDKWVRQLKQERDGISPTASPITADQIKIREIEKKYVELKRKENPKKCYDSFNVRLNENFSLVENLKESHSVQVICNLFNIHRSSYKYW